MRSILFIFFFLFSFSVAFSQKIDYYQTLIDKTEAEIALLSAQLKDNQLQQTKSSEKIKLLEKRLRARQTLISQTTQAISQLESKLKAYDSDVFKCTGIIDSLRLIYKNLVLSINEKSYSGDFFYQYYSTLLSDFTDSYVSVVDSLDHQIETCGTQRKIVSSEQSRLKKLLVLRKNEVNNILEETRQLDSLKKSLKKDESAMLSQIERQRSKINQLQREIERLVAMESQSNSTSYSNLSSSFESSKGFLPSPLRIKSKIIDQYGLHNHSSIAGVKVMNKGVNLAFKGPSEVLSVFKGVVRGIYSIAGMGKTVLVRHGIYITVYSNLSYVSVNKGEPVEQGQILGRVQGDSDDELFFHFELWKEQSTLDPTLWIKF